MTWQVSTDSQIEPDTDTLHYIQLAHKKKKKKKKKEKKKRKEKDRDIKAKWQIKWTYFCNRLNITNLKVYLIRGSPFKILNNQCDTM